MGKGVTKAVENVNNIIAPALVGKDPTDQKAIDDLMIELDGTKNKGKLGANAILAVSMAVSKAGAAEKGVPLYKHIADLAGNGKLVLPVPAFNVINGGSHAGNKLAMQEFMILPVGASTFAEAMRMGSEVYHNLKTVIKAKYGQDACNVGDEGGFAPNIQENKEGLELLKEAIEKAGYTGKIKIGMDVAAAEFYTEDKMYDLDFKTENNDGSMKKSGEEMIEMYKEFCSEYPIVSIEDPFDQDDWDGWTEMTAATPEAECQIVGDDLTVTNPTKIAKAVDEKAFDKLARNVERLAAGSVATTEFVARVLFDSRRPAVHNERYTPRRHRRDAPPTQVGPGRGRRRRGAPRGGRGAGLAAGRRGRVRPRGRRRGQRRRGRGLPRRWPRGHRRRGDARPPRRRAPRVDRGRHGRPPLLHAGAAGLRAGSRVVSRWVGV